MVLVMVVAMVVVAMTVAAVVAVAAAATVAMLEGEKAVTVSAAVIHKSAIAGKHCVVLSR